MATPGTSGTVVAVTGCVVVLDSVDVVVGGEVVVVVAVGSDGAIERSEPVWIVTVAPGVTAWGLYPMMTGPWSCSTTRSAAPSAGFTHAPLFGGGGPPYQTTVSARGPTGVRSPVAEME